MPDGYFWDISNAEVVLKGFSINVDLKIHVYYQEEKENKKIKGFNTLFCYYDSEDNKQYRNVQTFALYKKLKVKPKRNLKAIHFESRGGGFF